MPIKVLMPALSPTMTEGTLAKWHVKEGDSVESGDVIAEIETDKATMEVEAVDEGTVGKILVDEGTEGVAVNELIAVLLEEGEDASAADSVGAGDAPKPAAPAKVEEPKAAAEAPKAATPQASAKPAPAPAASGDRIFASPLARRIASNEGLDLGQLTGSGPHGRIIKVDVERALSEGTGKAAAPAAAPAQAPTPAPMSTENPFEPEFELQTLNNMRKTIARRLTESKQNVPHFYLSVDVELDKLLAMRKELNARADGAFKLSVNDIIIKAVGIALRKVPAANASWAADGVKLYKQADVSVAVAIDGGLITPVVRDAGNKGLESISNEMKALAGKARDGKLQPEEYQGGTFSVSNLGMFGIDQFQAVINPPQACILAVGAGKEKAVVKDGALSIATVMTATLSVDHRAVDGAIGAEFLKVFKGLMEEPLSMML
ncbi:pyruvate dehydrogenase complex dihydrolipoamide acetyltransferase [Aestuariispira ectoiniformans]|uniref:pyruvate dehydrogenase complex dihydrolipoamide acetyltransferase n=1 Tax=Aestuariispira ectoiniformans TaxID=2775080 RepID=UPI00223A8384|nr:pyruvate dehydrogenase complex dihydrolipoamide acetyltransferase [Aestuariispira ectoiniformans]